eukprot:TRINITY_DN2176_c0_g1_i1.p1 TRINITY_DN2176_c0_g1~~TRINITY_DN2176_c0_g1_i1.p1  ORF type:complete len:137 (-),score=17.95 TRINITY_DN2176_c0_g1_i1:21-431(-)
MAEGKRRHHQQKPSGEFPKSKVPESALEIHIGEHPGVATFIWENETHTLGNVIRHVLMANEEVSFCGYTVPHPLENKMKVHLRTVNPSGNSPPPAQEVMQKGLHKLADIMTEFRGTFDAALAEFHAQKDGMAVDAR